jgi:hypothetical protein
VTRLFEKFPSILTTDGTDGNAIFLEAQDGHKQHRNVENLGYLYFTEGPTAMDTLRPRYCLLPYSAVSVTRTCLSAHRLLSTLRISPIL